MLSKRYQDAGEGGELLKPHDRDLEITLRFPVDVVECVLVGNLHEEKIWCQHNSEQCIDVTTVRLDRRFVDLGDPRFRSRFARCSPRTNSRSAAARHFRRSLSYGVPGLRARAACASLRANLILLARPYLHREASHAARSSGSAVPQWSPRSLSVMSWVRGCDSSGRQGRSRACCLRRSWAHRPRVQWRAASNAPSSAAAS